ncbi:DUF5977 domain-containing protein [Pedobacter agri]|uniref:DUF5977 domain-containing protein n=1 Tax=Pedobacter agri TaxID=454586 RepID=UPI00292EBE2F|nr:hypothetical protein [Pedobacter agri]
MTNQDIYLIEPSGNYAKLDIESLDLSETTFAISDISDITTRKDTTTKNITLKGTKNNNRILGSIFNLNRIHDAKYSESLFFNYNFNKEVDCLLYENDSLINKGIFKITDVTVDENNNYVYNAVVTGYKVNFFSKIKDLLLSDLDFSNYNHEYSINNIVNSWSNTTGYVYGFADYGQSVFGDEETVNKIDFKDFRPSFYLHNYIEKVFEQPVLSGYTYLIDGNPDFLDKFNKLIIPNNADVLINTIKGGKVLYGTKSNQQFYFGDTNGQMGDQGNGVETYKTQVSWSNFSDDKEFFTPNTEPYFGFSNNIFTCTKTINTTVEVNINISYNTQFFSSSSTYFLNYDSKILILQRESSNQAWRVATESQITRVNTNGAAPSQNHLLKFKGSLNVQAGNQISICVYNDNYSHSNGTPPVFPASGMFYYNPQNSFFQIGNDISTTKYELELNDLIDFSNQVSFNTYKQADFIKSILNIFNLYVYSNLENPKHLIFTPYNDFYENFKPANLVSSSKNWSGKIDYSKLKINSFQQIFKNYKFSFKEDGDYLNALYKEKYGSAYGNYIYENNTSISNDTSVEIIFAGTPITTFGDRDLPLFFTYDSNNNKVARQSVIRLLFYSGLKSCSEFKIGNWFKNADNGQFQFQAYNSTYLSYPQLHTIYNGLDLNFGEPQEIYYKVIPEANSVFETFYELQIEEYNDSNTATIDVKALLNEIDISNLDFKKPLFIDSPNGSGYFKLLNVNYGNNTELSEITLQKIYFKDDSIGKIYVNASLSEWVINPACELSESIYCGVIAGKYSSKISQEDADSQAVVEFNALKAEAELNASCVVDNILSLAFSDSFVDACSNATNPIYYSSTGDLEIGNTLFWLTPEGIIKAQLGYYSNQSNYYQVDQYSIIVEIGSCIPPNT